MLAKPLAKQRFYFTILTLSNLQAAIIKGVKTQEKLTLTTIACALERYRIPNRVYPDTLAQLEPKFLAKIPQPMIAGQTFHYERTGDAFRLWSDGWNQTDDGGKGNRNASNGDWIWCAW